MPAPREILIELVQVGNTMRVNAIDVNSGTEVMFQAPANSGQATIKRIARDKLDYVMRKSRD